MEHDDVVESMGSSTDALLAPEIQHSTGSLVNKDVGQLIQSFRQLSSVSKTAHEEVEYTYDVDNVLSPIFENYKVATETSNDLRRSNVEDAILTKLYNMIEVFLIRQGLTLDFLKIFKDYINLLEEAKVDPFEDSYFLALENELSKGYEFTSTLQEIISAFLLKPENYAMKLAHFQFKRNKLILRRMYLSWKLRSALNANLAELECLWERYIQKKYILEWKNISYLKGTDWVYESIEFYEKRLKAVAYESWSASLDHLRTKEHVADNFFLNDILAKMHQKFRRLQTRSSSLSCKRNMFLCRDKFNAWKLQTCKARFVHQKSMMTLVRNHLKLLIEKKHFYHRYLVERSEFAEKNLVLRGRFKRWRQLAFRKQEKTDILYQEADMHFKAKYFKKWLAMRNLVVVEYSVRERNDKSLKRLIFLLLKKRFYISNLANTHLNFKELEVLRKYLEYWIFSAAMFNKANIQYSKKLKGRIVKKFVIRFKLLDYNRKVETSTQRETFNIWIRKLALKRQEKEFLNNITKNNFKKILHRQKSLADLGKITSKCFEGKVIMSFFMLWRQKHISLNSLKLKAVILMKMKAFNMVRRGYRSIAFKEVIASEFYLSNDKNILQKYWIIWDQALNTQKLVKLEILMDQLSKRRERSEKINIFKKWIRKTHFFLDDCQNVSDQKYFISTSSKVYNKWNSKIKAIQLLEAEALEISFGMTKSTAFHSWIQKYEAIQKNAGILLFYAEEKNIKLLSKWTNKWSMKVLKLKRNNEMVEMFRSRWNRASLRAVMALWKEKSFDSFSLSGDENIILANDHTKFQTPMRPHMNTHVTIPGSERLKKSKMDRIKDRFSRARIAIPSPIKMSEMLDTAMNGDIVRTTTVPTSTQQNPQTLTQINNRTYRNQSNSATISLLNVNKRLANRTKSINFGKIPETSPFGFPSPHPSNESESNILKVDLDFLKMEPDNDRDDSPTRRRSRM